MIFNNIFFCGLNLVQFGISLLVILGHVTQCIFFLGSSRGVLQKWNSHTPAQLVSWLVSRAEKK